jgi:hypothetical protein
MPGQDLRLRRNPAVVWLDDLEPFLNQGVTLQTLREWHAGRPGRIVAATYGGKGRDQGAGVGVVGERGRDVDNVAAASFQHFGDDALRQPEESGLPRWRYAVTSPAPMPREPPVMMATLWSCSVTDAPGVRESGRRGKARDPGGGSGR